VKQVGALVVYVGILWLVWIEGVMVISTDWRMMTKVWAVWRPSHTPWGLWLCVQYVVLVIMSTLCAAVVALTILWGVVIVAVQLQCVVEIALFIKRRKGLNGGQPSCDPERGTDSKEHENRMLEKKRPVEDETEG
jgi:hypothetical protein